MIVVGGHENIAMEEMLRPCIQKLGLRIPCD